MSDDHDRIDELEIANAQLNRGLEHCRKLVAELRSRLIANQNEQPEVASTALERVVDNG